MTDDQQPLSSEDELFLKSILGHKTPKVALAAACLSARRELIAQRLRADGFEARLAALEADKALKRPRARR